MAVIRKEQNHTETLLVQVNVGRQVADHAVRLQTLLHQYDPADRLTFLGHVARTFNF